MASRSDSGNETRESSESDNSPTPTRDLQYKSRFTPVKGYSRSQLPTPILLQNSPQVSSPATPVSQITPQPRVQQPKNLGPNFQRLTPTAPNRAPARPVQRNMGSAASVHVSVSLGSLASSRGRQRNSVAVVDSREHIYEELEMFRGPPKLTPVSGVLQQGKVVIRPIAFKPVIPQGAKLLPPGGQKVSMGKEEPRTEEVRHYPAIPARPDPRYTSTPTLSRGQIHYYGSMGDLKTVGHSSSYSLDRRNAPIPTPSRNYNEPYLNSPAICSSKYNSLKKYSNNNRNTDPTNKNYPNINNDHNISVSNILINKVNSNMPRNSPPSYPAPPPRPSSHQSTCSNLDNSHRYSYESQLSATFDQMPSYDSMQNTPSCPSRSTSGYDSSHASFPGPDLPRVESMKNLSREEQNYPSHNSFALNQQINGNRMRSSVSNLTRLGNHSGSIQGLDRSISGNGSNLGIERSNANYGLDRGTCTSMTGSLSELRINAHHETPSPSDSGVAELEAMLKEKDTEINSLKEAMEQNEQVIFKVYEQKEKGWEKELKKIRDMYDWRLKGAQQKALKVEQTLTTQTYQLQQERRKLTAELEETKREKESGSKQIDQLKKEVSSLRSQLEETEWGLCQKSGEISLLKTQLKDSQGDQTTRGHELLHLRAQVRQYQQEIERRRAEITSLHDLTAQLRKDNAEMRSQLDRSQQIEAQDHELLQQKEKTRIETESHRREMEMRHTKFEEERKRWQEEKERVLRYQKQLHHNYVSMLNRNRQLEEEVARLTGVPLPRRSMDIPAMPMLPPSYTDLRDSISHGKSESRC